MAQKYPVAEQLVWYSHTALSFSKKKHQYEHFTQKVQHFTVKNLAQGFLVGGVEDASSEFVIENWRLIIRFQLCYWNMSDTKWMICLLKYLDTGEGM